MLTWTERDGGLILHETEEYGASLRASANLRILGKAQVEDFRMRREQDYMERWRASPRSEKEKLLLFFGMVEKPGSEYFMSGGGYDGILQAFAGRRYAQGRFRFSSLPRLSQHGH